MLCYVMLGLCYVRVMRCMLCMYVMYVLDECLQEWGLNSSETGFRMKPMRMKPADETSARQRNSLRRTNPLIFSFFFVWSLCGLACVDLCWGFVVTRFWPPLGQTQLMRCVVRELLRVFSHCQTCSSKEWEPLLWKKKGESRCALKHQVQTALHMETHLLVLQVFPQSHWATRKQP